ncbi:radical SAM protein, partial [Alkaliphilus pronyensis]
MKARKERKMKSPLKKKLTEKEYSALVEMTTLTLPEFLGYALEKYPHIEGQEFYEFYLKQRALRLGRPLSLHCELTPLCNLSCKMCYVQLDESNAGLHSILTTSQWMEIFRQAIENDVYQVTLSGGEAMLHPGFWEIYDYLYSMGIRITIFTNGLSITNRAIEHLRKKPPQSIQISLYGTSDDVYEKVTGKRVFSQIEKVFLQLQEANIPFKIAVSPNRYLYNDMENILQYLYNKGYSFQVNRNLLPPREETGRNLKDIALTTNEYVDIWTLYKKTTNMHPFSEEIRDNQDGISCSAGMATCHINYKGEMNGC